MDNNSSEAKQRNRRRKRAQRMQAIREKQDDNKDDSGEEDGTKEKPQRPPCRRKKAKEKDFLAEEDIIDGFAILAFKTYEDLETCVRLASEKKIHRLAEIERPKKETRSRLTHHHISAHTANHGLTSIQDPATSDDSGRASERLTGSSVAPRDADSSRDRLSDASSRCSSGKGYICDSEGEDDKGSDASSVIFASTPASRKHEFPGALPPSLPLSNGASNSPVPAPTPPNLPVPSPAPAQQPPAHPLAAATATGHKAAATATSMSSPPQPPASVPVVSMPTVPAVTMPQAATAPHPPLPPDSAPGGASHGRTDSPAVATSANAAVQPGGAQYHPSSYHHPHHHHSVHQQPSLYAPYAVHSPYATAVTTVTTAVSSVSTYSTTNTATATSARESTTTATRAPSPRNHSPVKDRENYSNVISLSRGSTTPSSCPPPTTVSSSLTLGKSWSGTALPPPSQNQQPQQQQQPPNTAPPRPTPPLHSSYPASHMFTAPLPPPVSTASPLTTAVPPPPQPQPPPSNPNPFSAENLFQPTAKKPNNMSTHARVLVSEAGSTAGQDVHKYSHITPVTNPLPNQADMLRRELDSRFLASQDRSLPVAPPPYMRTEMHQHQHHHTHVHQHTTSLLPPPPASTLFPSPLFKDIPKLGSVESPFYRQNLGMSAYPGYSPSLLHPGLAAGPTPFVPPNHLPSFQPKSTAPDPGKPKIMKSGKWNAMHVRVAWEIYHHQQKGDASKPGAVKTDLLRPPTHLFSPNVHHTRPHDLPFPSSLPTHRTPTFDQAHPGSLFSAPPSHIGSTLSPFTRYGAAGFASNPSPFAMSPFASARDLPLGPLHDPWRGLQRTVPGFPPSVSALPPSLPGLAPPAPWTIKPDPIIEQREREEREREQRERERLRREREERERKEREERQRRIEQQQQQERERERREKERREHERRELEQRERERERMLQQQQQQQQQHHHHHQQQQQQQQQQQRYAETSKHLAPTIRERSPLCNGGATDPQEIRVKEEPRTKEEELLGRTDARYHPYLRHAASLQPPSVLDRSRMLGHHHGLAAHYPPPHHGLYAAPHPADSFYRYDPLRYNQLVDAAIRAEEERVKMFGGYGAPHPSQLRAKEAAAAGLLHLRPGPGPPPPTHKLCATPPTDLLKKDEPR